jgi:hypothetical protein
MRRIIPALLALSLFAIAVPLDAARAQATRTWVSGVGDDANPCSRTAPCKTFAGAISKTAAGGEIDALDPGGYGTVTITKSITIDGSVGTVAGILATATNGINVNAASTDRIILRNLSINGAGLTLGTNGIRFLAGNSLLVENVSIANFSNNCISFEPANKANLLVSRSSMSNCAAGAIVSSATSGGSNFVQINNSTFFKSGAPVKSGQNSTMEISNSVITANGGGGVSATTASSVLNVQQSQIVNNTTFGVQSSGGAVVRLSQTNVTNNAGPGLQSLTGGQLVSFGNNFIAGNSPDGSFTSTIPPQ